jgi:hypothetical protein
VDAGGKREINFLDSGAPPDTVHTSTSGSKNPSARRWREDGFKALSQRILASAGFKVGGEVLAKRGGSRGSPSRPWTSS